MKKVVRLGETGLGDLKYDVFCKIEITDGKLSITGVVGPKKNGDAAGSCGQIERTEIVALAPGWTQDMVSRFFETWQKWHLNDMRPG